MATTAERIRIASGQGKADLLVRNGQVVDVFSGQIEKKDVAVYGGIIIGFGDYPARKIVDLEGDFLCPGLIDGHVHVESSMVTVPEFARAVVPRGTTTVVIDPHEIANVLGQDGVRYMAESAVGTPLNVLVMVPSCVPATHLETSGAILNSDDLKPLLDEPWAIGLAEVMNFPGVISADPDVLSKIEAARGKRVDGHAPLLTGKALSAYLVAGVRSDHECTTLAEAKEKLKSGMWIMIREGTTARNLRDLLPAVSPQNSRRFFFVTDDRHPGELLGEGHIDSMVRQAVDQGLDPFVAIQMATLNTAEYFRLDGLGAIAPGYRADMVSFDHLSRFQIKKVFKDGALVAENGKWIGRAFPKSLPHDVTAQTLLKKKNTVHVKPFSTDELTLKSDSPWAKVIEIIPGQIVTRKAIRKIVLRDGVALPDLNQDVLKIVVVERHRGTGNIGIGFVHGFGLKRGAIGSSVAHDSHNLVIVGLDDNEIFSAVKALEEMGGGLVAVSHGKVLASVRLPIAGLMADIPIRAVDSRFKRLLDQARALGSRLADPFMALSFISLPVIPEFKITDKGLVDVNRFELVPLFGEE
jgi:adenine deaminase